jgi:RNA polymerase sigma-70 factor (ECF subfamily)
MNYFVTKLTWSTLMIMSENLEHSFVTQLKENQNIIHKICRLYTDCEDLIKTYFKKWRFNYGKHFQNLEATASTWAYRVALNTAITLYRKTNDHYLPLNMRAVSTLLHEYNYEEEEIKLMYKAVYQLNDIEKALVLCTSRIRLPRDSGNFRD